MNPWDRKTKNVFIILFVILFLLPSAVFATDFPHGCNVVGFTFNYNLLVLKSYDMTSPQTLYLIHNKSTKPIKLMQMVSDDKPYVMNLTNLIHAGQWAALAMGELTQKYICTTPRPKSKFNEILNCRDVLEICEYNNVKFGPNNHGNYFPVASDSLEGVVREVIKHGILLRW